MVVRMRSNRSHTGNRRSHHALVAPRVTMAKDGAVPHLRHRMCLTTGMYRGRKVIDVTAKIDRKTKKASAKAGAARGEAGK